MTALLSLLGGPGVGLGHFVVLTGQLAFAFLSISLAFLSSSQVWELTILGKINDLILSIHAI